MSDSLSLVELLAELVGAELRLRREGDESLIDAAILKLPDGRQILAVERSYRIGIRIILDPTPEELAVARDGDLWAIWNSQRGRLVITLF